MAHYEAEQSEEFVTHFLPTGRGLVQDVSEMRFDESVIRQSMMNETSELDYIEEIVEEEEEDFTEVEVLTDDEGGSVEIIEEEVIEDESEVESSPPPPADAYPSPDDSPPFLAGFTQNPPGDSLPIRASRPSNDEEKVEEGYEEGHEVIFQKQVEPPKNENKMDHPEAIRDFKFRRKLFEDEESDEGADYDFAPCLDVTDEVEEELTRRLHGATRDALDAWDLRHLELTAPRPDPAPQPASGSSQTPPVPRMVTPTSVSPDDGLQSSKAITNKATLQASPSKYKDAQASKPETAKPPASSDLHWAARKAMDTIYPDNYCVPPITSLEEFKEASPVDNADKSTDNFQRSDLKWAARKAAGTIYPENYIVPPIASLENVWNEEYVSLEPENQTTASTSASNQRVKTLDDDPPEAPVADTDASTNSEASESSASLALSSSTLFWAVQNSLEAVYPVSGGIPPITVAEQDDDELEGHMDDNTQIFAPGLRQYQQERQRAQEEQEPRMPQEDDLSASRRRKQKPSDEHSNSTQSIGRQNSTSATQKPLALSEAALDVLYAGDGREMEDAQSSSSSSSSFHSQLREDQPDEFQDEPDATSPQSGNSSFQSQLEEDRQEKFLDEPVWATPNSRRVDQGVSVSSKLSPSNIGYSEGRHGAKGKRRAPRLPNSVRLSEGGANVSKLFDTPSNYSSRRKSHGQVGWETPPMVENWHDEEAQHLSPNLPPKEVLAAIYNTDPTNYDRNEVVYERELIPFPEDMVKEPKNTLEAARVLTRRLLLALLLVVPITVGTFLALRKGM